MLNNEVLTNYQSQSVIPNRELFRKISKKLKNLSNYTSVIFCTILLSVTIMMTIMPKRTINKYDSIYAYGHNVQIINIDNTEHICKNNSYNAKINHNSIKANIELEINNINEFVDYVQSEISIPAYKNQNTCTLMSTMYSSINIDNIQVTGSKVKVSITYDKNSTSIDQQDNIRVKFIQLAKEYGIKNLDINNEHILQNRCQESH